MCRRAAYTTANHYLSFLNAEERTRTSTPVREPAPEAGASASSATSACRIILWPRGCACQGAQKKPRRLGVRSTLARSAHYFFFGRPSGGGLAPPEPAETVHVQLFWRSVALP